MRSDGDPAAALGGPDPAIEEYARAAARLQGFSIDEAWWPELARHLGLLISLGEDLERNPPPASAEPARSRRTR